MVELQISNLLVRVRFPYPAPNTGFTLLPNIKWVIADTIKAQCIGSTARLTI